MAVIESRGLLAHATLLASDEFGGRLTASPGQVATAKYIAGHFAWLGLEPLGDEAGEGRSYFQRYGIDRTRVMAGTELQFGDVSLRAGFALLAAGPMSVQIEGNLRFTGLGHTRGLRSVFEPDETLDGDVAVAVIKPLRGRVDRQLSVEDKFMMSFTSFGRIGTTTANLEKKGAGAVVFLMLDDAIGLADVLNYLAVAPGKDSLSPRFDGADNTMGQMSALMGRKRSIPTIVLSVARSRELLAQLGIGLEGVRAWLDGEGAMPAAEVTVPAKLDVVVERDEEATACNVAAVLRGSDPELGREAIVYSAHMDHVGLRMDGDVFNGADDNASGTAGLLAIASAFAAGEERPRRSIIFLSVSGEELGLWGSAYYADNPTWPIDEIVANINTDMIGRSGPESGPFEVTVTPSHRHMMFSTLVQRAARLGERLDVAFVGGDKYYARSDHISFARKGIPVVFFCNGEHEDYHQVSDHADKLDGDKMERIARLAYWTGWLTANDDERPQQLGRQDGWR